MEGGINIFQSVRANAKWLIFSVGYILIIASNLTPNGDTFWALKTGQWVVEHGIPFTDPFSWTARGLPWVAHEWLFDGMLYWLSAHLGFWGMALTVWPAVAGFIICVWYLCRAESKSQVATMLIFSLAIMLPSHYVVTRPQVYSYFFFSFFLYVLTWKSGNRWRWVLPFMTVLWANMHGSVVLGVAMVVFQAVLESVYEKRHTMWLVALVVFLASMLNPQGIGLLKYAAWLSTDSWNHKIDEWRPPDFTDFGNLYIYAILFLTIACALYIRKRGTSGDKTEKRRLISTLLYFLGFSLVAITGVRYYPYLAVCWAVLFLRLVPDEFLAKYKIKLLNAMALIAFAGLLVASIPKLPPQSIAAGIDQDHWPVQAVSYIKENRLEDHLFNYYTWGGYLIWRDVPPFVDGRSDIYIPNSTVFRDYIGAVDIKSTEDVLRKYGIKTVLTPKNSPLRGYLEGRPGWENIYQDEVAVIFQNK